MENRNQETLKDEIEQVLTSAETDVQEVQREIRGRAKPIRKGKGRPFKDKNRNDNEEYFEVARIFPIDPYTKKERPDTFDVLWVVDLRKEKAYPTKPNFKNGKMVYSVNNQRYSLDQKDLKQTGPNCWRIEISYNS